jgi:hypothetical protein
MMNNRLFKLETRLGLVERAGNSSGYAEANEVAAD